MKLLHISPTLQVGGAERFLQRLAPRLARRHGVEQRVLALRGDGPVGEALRNSGIDARTIDARGPTGLLRATFSARTAVAEWQPDVVQTWLYYSDMVGSLATLGRDRTRLVWNLRCSDVWLRPQTLVLRRACIALSAWLPDAIIACGERAAEYHRSLGYPADLAVIPNGYEFAPLDKILVARAALQSRPEPRPILVGAVGRYDPAKGYEHLLAAIALLRRQGHNVRLTIAGRGCDDRNPELGAEIARHELDGAVDLRGELDDLQPFFSMIDIFCLSSVSEGFPNALCEAIANAVPAIATGVGDAPQIMGPERTVPAGRPEALAAGIEALIDMPADTRQKRAVDAARRVRQTYDLDLICDRYYAAYQRVVASTGR